MIGKLAVTGATIGLGSLAVSNILEQRMLSTDKEIYPTADTVSIIIPAYNEERYIEDSLKSIRDQSIISQYPQMFEVVLVDSGSQDRTVELASPYVDKVIIGPRGKLTARNLATLQSRGNIIVSYDADAIYPDGSLNTILKPFNFPNIAAVHGSNIDHNGIAGGVRLGPLFPIYHVMDVQSHPYQMNGGNSAYWKHLFYLSGMFDDTINQFDSSIVQKEEERNFGERLSHYGKILYKINAPKIHLGGEKVICRQKNADRRVCDNYKIGVERMNEK